MDNIIQDEVGTIKIPECQTAISCLVCGEKIITSDIYRYPIVCEECKRAVELVKMLYKNKPCWNCKDPKCGICNTFTIS